MTKATDGHRQPRKTGGNDLIGGIALEPALVRTNLEAEMDNHAEDQEFSKARAISKLDWPTPEMLRAARGAKARALYDMALALGRWLTRRPAQPVLAASRSPVGHH